MTLPRYSPPMTLSASLAAGLAPLAVLLAFVLIVTRVIDVDTGLAVFAACALWVAAEMQGYQRTLDAYNAGYVAQHLAWRGSDTLAALAAHERTDPATRDFVQGYVIEGRRLRPDRPLLNW